VTIQLPPMSPLPTVDGTSNIATSDPSATETETESEPVVGKSPDEAEIVGLWNQVWTALFMCLALMGPVFLTIVFGCYTLGFIQQSQAIACVGVIYTLLFLTIMGSYCLVILPCILLSRLFTSLIAPGASPQSAAQATLYSRLLILLAVTVGSTAYFLKA
jgi:hypothetical protein